LPGLAVSGAGPAIMISYLLAAIHLVPGVFCMAELSTAMPRSGGIYYFLDRSMGPLMGTIGGLGTWLALILKTSFALIGMGVYVGIFFPDLPMKPTAVVLALLFGWLNLFGAKKTGTFQVILVVTLLGILSWFIGLGATKLNFSHFKPFFDEGFASIYATAGLVFISYVGLTKIASVSEEVKNPERNLPLAMFLALGAAVIIYGVGTTVMVGVIPPDLFENDLAPVATAAHRMVGEWGAVVMSIAAVLAFFSISNAAILSASRYPLAMSRDHLLPRFFRFLNKHRTPKIAILVTVGMIIFCIIFLNPTKIAKLASAFQLLLFSLCCLAVIIMRESQIQAYDPGYRSPFYPWLPIVGMLSPLYLIVEMGIYPTLFTLGLITIGVFWFVYYASDKVERDGAIFHYFARLGERKYQGLDRELRGIIKEKGLREEDPFEIVVARATIFDIKGKINFDQLVEKAATVFSDNLGFPKDRLKENFMQGTKVGATPVSNGAALPHLRLSGIHQPEVVIFRTRKGVLVEVDDVYIDNGGAQEPVYAFFFLVSPEENPGQHLRLLAQIAGQVDDEDFLKQWLRVKEEQDLREILLRHEHYLRLHLLPDEFTGNWIGKAVRDLHIPAGTLIAIIHRGKEIIIPRGSTILQEDDRLTIIGAPSGIKVLNEKYLSKSLGVLKTKV